MEKKTVEPTCSLKEMSDEAIVMHDHCGGLCNVEVSDGKRKIKLGIKIPKEVIDLASLIYELLRKPIDKN